MREGFDSSFIAPPFRGTLSVRLVVEGTIIIIVPLVVSFPFDAVSFLEPNFDLSACISIVDDVVQVSIIPVSSVTTFLRWSETAGQVPTWTLTLVRVLTSYFVAPLKNLVHFGSCIQHCLDALNLRVDFFVVLRQVGCGLVDDHS
jgi:hypothetical protein